MKKQNPPKQSTFRTILGFFMAFMLAMVLRSFVAEPYNIPSSSMTPTLLVGDYLFISKYPYGYSRHSFPYSLPLIPKGRLFENEPKRGDVVIFRMTPELSPNIKAPLDYIKRVIGLPGDTVQVKEGRLYINNTLVEREFVGIESDMINNELVQLTKYTETLPNGKQHFIYEVSDTAPKDNTPPIIIPEGYFLPMGDNRDNSYDGRFFGPVPLTHLEGRAEFLFYSNNGQGMFLQFWKWADFIRFDRIFTRIL